MWQLHAYGMHVPHCRLRYAQCGPPNGRLDGAGQSRDEAEIAVSHARVLLKIYYI